MSTAHQPRSPPVSSLNPRHRVRLVAADADGHVGLPKSFLPYWSGPGRPVAVCLERTRRGAPAPGYGWLFRLEGGAWRAFRRLRDYELHGGDPLPNLGQGHQRRKQYNRWLRRHWAPFYKAFKTEDIDFDSMIAASPFFEYCHPTL